MSSVTELDMARLSDGKMRSFCRRHRIARAAVFGSALRHDFGPDSDVDLLVEFEPDGVPGLVGLAAMEIELSALLGRRADINTAACLSMHFRDEVVREVQTIYVAP